MTFVSALLAPGRSPEIPDSAAIYDFLIGDWDAEVIDHEEDGSTLRNRAEIHFAWVLEGRAIQDLWISAPRRYGTTLRRYDRLTGEWRVTWINPVNGAENRLVARKVGDDLVQEGRREDGSLIRWSFREITPDSFHWIGEESHDEGKTWRCGTEFLARRRRAWDREALWVATNGDGFEHVRLSLNPIVIEGVVVRRGLRATYRIECDAAWRTRAVSIDDRLVPLDGCIDVDILASPFTNTLAINRLALEPGQSEEIRVAFIDPANATARPVEQRYTRLDANRYRYEGLASGFTAELPVDEDGLLIEYPGYFRRAW